MKTTHSERLLAKYDSELGLSEQQFLGLALLSALLSEDLDLDKTEKQIVADFIAEAVNNKTLRTVFSQLELRDHLQATPAVLAIAFRTRHLDFYLESVANMAVSYKKLQTYQSLTESEKVTLKEFAMLYDLAALYPLFEKLDRMNIIPCNQVLEALKKEVARSHDIMHYLEMVIKVDPRFRKEPFLSGQIQKGSKGHQQAFAFFSPLTTLFVNKDLLTISPNKPKMK